MNTTKTFQKVKIFFEDNKESSNNSNASKSIDIDLPLTYKAFINLLLTHENLDLSKNNGIYYRTHDGENQVVSESNYDQLQEGVISNSLNVNDGAYFFVLVKEKTIIKKETDYDSKLYF